MSKVIESLRQDHVNILRLLNLLEKQVAVLQAHGDPDWDQVSDILGYMAEYPDVIHHPLEDVIYRRFLEVSKEEKTREMVDELLSEHHDLPEVTQRLRSLVGNLQEGAFVMTKDELIQELNDYISLQREHLQHEEAKVFPVIDKTLSADDWRSVEEEAPGRSDPVFGPVTAEQFKRLYQSIINH